MYNLIKLPKEELNTIVINTAARKGMNTAIVEKDLWHFKTITCSS